MPRSYATRRFCPFPRGFLERKLDITRRIWDFQVMFHINKEFYVALGYDPGRELIYTPTPTPIARPGYILVCKYVFACKIYNFLYLTCLEKCQILTNAHHPAKVLFNFVVDTLRKGKLLIKK